MVKIYGIIYVKSQFSLRECEGKVKHFFMEKKIVLKMRILRKAIIFFTYFVIETNKTY